MKVFMLVFCISLLLFSFESLGGDGKRHVAIIVETLVNDPGPLGNADRTDAGFVTKFEKLFPDSEILLVRAGSNAEVIEKLKASVSASNTIIDGLIVNSHGESFAIDYDFGTGSVDVKQSNISNKYDKFFVNLLSSEDVVDVFSPIVGKFSDNAKIIFLSCNTIKIGNEKEKLLIMKQIAKNFGMNDGYIYMNSQVQIDAFSRLATQPVQEQGSIGLCAFQGVNQILAPVMYPLAVIADHTNANHGYTLKVEDGKRYALYRDDRFNQMNKPGLGNKENKLPVVCYEEGVTDKASYLSDNKQKNIHSESSEVATPHSTTSASPANTHVKNVP